MWLVVAALENMFPTMVCVAAIDLIFSDVLSLRCSDLNDFEWETVRSVGRAPEGRYGHTMALVKGEGDIRIVVFGGMSIMVLSYCLKSLL